MPRGLDYSQDLKGIHLALAGASKSLHNGLIFELEELIFKGKYCKVFGQRMKGPAKLHNDAPDTQTCILA